MDRRTRAREEAIRSGLFLLGRIGVRAMAAAAKSGLGDVGDAALALAKKTQRVAEKLEKAFPSEDWEE
jgi:hypothetical protein